MHMNRIDLNRVRKSLLGLRVPYDLLGHHDELEGVLRDSIYAVLRIVGVDQFEEDQSL
jgi:hypothetical protein